MSNIHTKPFYKLITALFLALGIAVTGSSAHHILGAKLTGEESLMAVSHLAAPTEDDLTTLMVGMLLVLAGFSFHALYVVRQREPIHVKMDRRPRARSKRGIRRR